jgi:hypothetical protein
VQHRQKLVHVGDALLNIRAEKFYCPRNYLRVNGRAGADALGGVTYPLKDFRFRRGALV